MARLRRADGARGFRRPCPSSIGERGRPPGARRGASARRRLERHARPPRLGEPDRDRLLRRARAVLPLPDVVHLFAHELAGRRRGALSRGQVALCFPNCALAWHSGNVNRSPRATQEGWQGNRPSRWRCLRWLSARARAQTHCRAPPEGAAPALAATDGRVRLEWIDQRLSHEAHRMSWWNYGWAIGIGASGVGSLIAVPFVAPENRVDYYTGAVLAAVGVIPFLLAPPDVIHDGARAARQAQPSRHPAPTTRSARCSPTPSAPGARRAQRAPALRLVVARRERRHQRRRLSLPGLRLSPLALGDDQRRPGFVIGEAVIFTQPRGTIDDLWPAISAAIWAVIRG